MWINHYNNENPIMRENLRLYVFAHILLLNIHLHSLFFHYIGDWEIWSTSLWGRLEQGLRNYKSILTSARELFSTIAIITGASPLTEKPKPSVVLPLWSCINLGAVQCLFAEKMAMGPRDLKRSLTRYWAKSGGVRFSWNLVAAVEIEVIKKMFIHIFRREECSIIRGWEDRYES